MRRAVPYILSALIAVGLLSIAGPARSQTVEGLQLRPSDSAEADRLRVWAAAENTQNCRMKIVIYDDSNRVVRNLIEFLASPGYYNFYWDKRDDSGARVPSGKYRAKVDYCLKVDYENLTVQYSAWEKQSELLPMDSAHPFSVGLKLDGGATPIVAELLDLKGRPVDVMVKDTIVGEGTHWFTYQPPIPHKRGNYMIRVKAGDAEFRREVSYLP